MALEYLTVEHLNTKELIRVFSQIQIRLDLQFNNTPCWLWIGGLEKEGYGITFWFKSQQRVHRLLFAWLVHPIPKGTKYGELDHLCRQRACCNPSHLEFVSSRINVLRGDGPPAKNARKTHCKRGHELNGDNLIFRRGMRQCRTCAKQWYIDYRDRRNELARNRYRLINGDFQTE